MQPSRWKCSSSLKHNRNTSKFPLSMRPTKSLKNSSHCAVVATLSGWSTWILHGKSSNSLTTIHRKFYRLTPSSCAACLIYFRAFSQILLLFSPQCQSWKQMPFTRHWLKSSHTLPFCSNFSINRVIVFRSGPTCTLNTFSKTLETITRLLLFSYLNDKSKNPICQFQVLQPIWSKKRSICYVWFTLLWNLF